MRAGVADQIDESFLNALEQMKLNERLIEALEQTNKVLITQLEDALEYRQHDLARRPTGGKRCADEVEQVAQHVAAKDWFDQEKTGSSNAETLEEMPFLPKVDEESDVVVRFRSVSCDGDEEMDFSGNAGLAPFLSDEQPQEYNEGLLQRFIDLLRNDDAWRSPIDVAQQVAALERICGELTVPRDIRLAGHGCSRPPLVTRASTTGSIGSTDSLLRASMCSTDSCLHQPSLVQSMCSTDSL